MHADFLKKLKHDLQQLPSLEPPPRAWTQIRAEVERRSRRRRTTPWPLVSAAVAASLVATPTLLWLMHTAPGHVTTREIGNTDTIQSLVTRSQGLEAILQTLPPRPTVERAATSATIDDLQNRIQLLDQQLSAAPQDDWAAAQRLWSTRVELMNSLLYVRYAEAAQTGRPPENSSTTGAI